MNYKSAWLTLNRACNLRCKWCYAQSTNYSAKDNMDVSLANQLINLFSEMKIRHVTLIGGEPTIYPKLFEIIDYCKQRNICPGIVTNGLACKDISFVDKLIEHGIHGLSISLKGENRDVFEKITGRDAFEETILAVKNCLAKGIRVSMSMVLTEDNIYTFLDGVKKFLEIGVDNFHFSFCYEFNMDSSNKNYLSNHDIKNLVKSFIEVYPELDHISHHRFSFQNGLPLCLWPEDFLEKMNKKGQISTVCQLLAKSGLIFDTDGYIIPCNAMPTIKLGRFKKDFTTVSELLTFMDTANIKKVYSKLCGLPDTKCLNCRKLVNCGGGCVCQWTNYSFEELSPVINDDRRI